MSFSFVSHLLNGFYLLNCMHDYLNTAQPKVADRDGFLPFLFEWLGFVRHDPTTCDIEKISAWKKIILLFLNMTKWLKSLAHVEMKILTYNFLSIAPYAYYTGLDSMHSKMTAELT